MANGVKFDFHILPSGLVQPNAISVIGNGVVAHLPAFFEEIAKTEAKGVSCKDRLFLSDRAHLVLDLHQIADGMKEQELGAGNIGTTRKGIGPAYSSKAQRDGIRVHHLIYDFPEFERRLRDLVGSTHKRFGNFDYDVDAELVRYKMYAEQIRPYVIDSVTYLNNAMKHGKRVLVEGANAIMLDIDFGTYPFVTSSNTGVGGVCTGLGLAPSKIGKVIGVVKAYTTRVGSGPFPTEQLNDIGEHLQTVGFEVGVTTGRKRRCGWLDIVVCRWSHMVNDYSSVMITKLDVLDQLKEIKIGVSYLLDGKKLDAFPSDLGNLAKVQVEYETLPGWQTDITKCKSWADLPENAKKYVERIEQLMGCPVEWVGVGPERESTFKKA